jgi:peroxiredoxin
MRLYKYVVIIALLAACNNRNSGRPFNVDGNIKNTTAKMVYLEEVPLTGSHPVILDSSKIGNDGNFQLKTTSKGDGLYSIRTEQKIFPLAVLINDAPKITVNADLANQTQPYTTSGSEASAKLIDFDKAISNYALAIFQSGNKVDSQSKANPADSTTAIQYAQLEKQTNDLKNYALDFINKSKNPVLTLYALDSYQNMTSNIGIKGLSRTEIATIVNTAAAKFKNNQVLEDAQKKLAPQKAADFTLPDVNGKPVSLSSFKGKYVLLDFWASWCGPCRKDNPNVVRAYNQFRDRNFTILGVSLDQNKDAWVKAINEDGLNWTQVSDLKFWNSAAAALYKVEAIPYNVLVDPNGNIIGENLHGEELVRTLQGVLK